MAAAQPAGPEVEADVGPGPFGQRTAQAEGKHHSEAVIALARRRVNVLRALIRDRRCYRSPAAA
ncbi:hypothetical protein GCM10010402_37940 [Actinomadura luteofluorescens]